MKHNIFYICLFVLLPLSAVAQEAELTREEIEDRSTLIVNSFPKNWEIDFGIGMQGYVGEYQNHMKFTDWWCPSVKLNATKWATPVFGLGLGLTYNGYRGLYLSDSDIRATFRQDGDELYMDTEYTLGKGRYLNIYFHGDFNLMNIGGNWRPDRFYQIIAQFQAGLAFPTSKVAYRPTAATFGLILRQQFRVNKYVAINFDLNSLAFSDHFNGLCYLSDCKDDKWKSDFSIGASLGVSVKFGFVTRVNRATQEEIVQEWIPMTTFVESSKYVEQNVSEAVAVNIAPLVDTLENKTREIDSVNVVIAEKVTQAPKPDRRLKRYWNTVNFKIDTWIISNREEMSIMSSADFIKQNPDKMFEVVGFADKQTGKTERNWLLSKNRAQVVYDRLVNEYGVNPAQLVKSYRGGVEDLYLNSKQCSRSTVIRLIED